MDEMIELANDMNDLKFFHEILKREEKKLIALSKELLNLKEVRLYQNLISKSQTIKEKRERSSGDNKDLILKELILLLKAHKKVLEYKEVKEYQEVLNTLKDYNNYRIEMKNYQLDNEGRIYNKDNNPVKVYNIEFLITTLALLKNDPNITLTELILYRENVVKYIQSFKHYKDDEIVTNFLGTNIYQNPKNYFVEPINIDKLKDLDNLDYDEENKKIKVRNFNNSIKLTTEREISAFYNFETLKLFGIETDEKILKKGQKNDK